MSTPATLPADFFDKKQAPDTLPADFFAKKSATAPQTTKPRPAQPADPSLLDAFMGEIAQNVDIPAAVSAANESGFLAPKPGDEAITQGLKWLGRTINTVSQGLVLSPADELSKSLSQDYVQAEDKPYAERVKASLVAPAKALGHTAKKLLIDPQVQLSDEADQLDQAAMTAKAQGDQEGARNLAVAASNKRALSILPMAGPMISAKAEQIGKSVDEGNPQGVVGAALDLGAESGLTAAGLLGGLESVKNMGTAKPSIENGKARAAAQREYRNAVLELKTKEGKPFDAAEVNKEVVDLSTEDLLHQAQVIRAALEIRSANQEPAPQAARPGPAEVPPTEGSPAPAMLDDAERAHLEQAGFTVDSQGRLARLVQRVDNRPIEEGFPVTDGSVAKSETSSVPPPGSVPKTDTVPYPPDGSVPKTASVPSERSGTEPKGQEIPKTPDFSESPVRENPVSVSNGQPAEPNLRTNGKPSDVPNRRSAERDLANQVFLDQQYKQLREAKAAGDTKAVSELEAVIAREKQAKADTNGSKPVDAATLAAENVRKMQESKDAQIQSFVDKRAPKANRERGAVRPDLLMGLGLSSEEIAAAAKKAGVSVAGVRPPAEQKAPEGKPPINPPSTKVTPPGDLPLQGDIKGVSGTLSALEGELLKQVPAVKETGTYQPKDARPDLAHKGGTKNVPVSEKSVEQLKAKFVEAGEKLKATREMAEREADHVTVEVIRAAEQRFKETAKEFNKARASWGRTGRVFQRGVIESLAEEARQLGVDVGRITAKARDPLLVRAVELWNETKAEGLNANRAFKAGGIGWEAFRQNVYSLTSFGMDVFANGVHTAKEIPGLAVGDLLSGDASFASTRGMLKAIANAGPSPESAIGKRLPNGLQGKPPGKEAGRQLGSTASGERFEPLGVSRAFGLTGKKALIGNAAEAALTLPLRLKTLADSLSKNTWYNANLYASAIEQAHKQGLSGVRARQFVDQFVANPPEWANKKAVAEGNRAGFNVQLSDFENRIAGNKVVQAAVDAFPRFTFQFTRWMGDALGVNPSLYKRIARGEATPREVSRYLTSVATGVGGIYLVNKLLYPNIDFQTMEYRHENGDRTRLSNLSPIPEALYLAALIRGDKEKAKATLQYVNIPVVKGINRGLLSNLGDASQDFFTGKIDSERFSREAEKTITTAIPGQALLRALWSMHDNTRREGILGLGKPIPKPTTGEPDKPRQRLFGFDIPVMAGTPIPGARRILDPVEKLMIDHGIGTLRPRRTPIAEFGSDDVPKELRTEFEELSGKKLNELVTRLEDDPSFQNANYDNRRRALLARVEKAKEFAKAEIARRRGVSEKSVRQPSTREKLLPIGLFRKGNQ